MSGARRWRTLGARATLLAAALLALSYVAIDGRWGRPPYGPFGKQLAWLLGIPEGAYNFDVVIPGKLYRSGRPDASLIEYLRESYGVERVVSLEGPFEHPDAARALGIDVSEFHWNGDALPPSEEIQRLLDLIDGGGPVLVYCFHGQKRTGLAVAAYRVLRQRWNAKSAIEEMVRHGYNAENRSSPRLNRDVEKLLGIS